MNDTLLYIFESRAIVKLMFRTMIGQVTKYYLRHLCSRKGRNLEGSAKSNKIWSFSISKKIEITNGFILLKYRKYFKSSCLCIY